MRIDAHHHLWDLVAVHYPWLETRDQPRFFGDPKPIQRNYLVDEFRETAAKRGFDASVHIQVGAEDGLAEARWVDSVAAANPGWPAVQVAFADLTDDAFDDRLASLAELPSVRGIRQIVGRAPAEDRLSGTGKLLDNPDFLAGLRKVAHAGLTFDLQLHPELMDGSAHVYARVPELGVVLCHAGSPIDRTREGRQYWARELRKLSELPNMYCKLSGLGMFEHGWTPDSIRPFVETCLEQFGPERCMFGSNFPVDSLTSDYSTLVDAYSELIPPQFHEPVFGGTASEFYRIA
ncbi:MAG: amidohydrolase family protein [Rhodobacteraceae bacterium]|nr:amidohydrolase family protein [Paracoccaceae bacterium]